MNENERVLGAGSNPADEKAAIAEAQKREEEQLAAEKLRAADRLKRHAHEGVRYLELANQFFNQLTDMTVPQQNVVDAAKARVTESIVALNAAFP